MSNSLCVHKIIVHNLLEDFVILCIYYSRLNYQSYSKYGKRVDKLYSDSTGHRPLGMPGYFFI